MSILAYVGPPGAGKSYSVIENQLVPALKEKRIVVTNLALKLDVIKRDFPDADIRTFEPAQLLSQPEMILEMVPPGALLILEEVWRLFPAGSKSNQVPEPFRMVFAEHRHRMDTQGRSSQIVLITQDLKQIGSFARLLVEQTYRMVKLETLGVPIKGRYRVDIYAGPQEGPNPPVNSRIRQIFAKYKPSVYQYYTSHTQSEAGEGVAVDESKVDTRANVFKRPIFIALPFFAVAVIGLSLWKGGYLMNKYGDKKKDLGAVAAISSGGAVAASAPKSPSFFQSSLAKVEGAGDWKVIGTLRNAEHADKSFAVLRSDSLKRTVEVKLSKCIVMDDLPTRCSYDGFMYSSDGKPAVTIDAPLGVAPPLPAVQPVLPPALAEAAPLDPYSNESLVQDPVTHVVEFRKPRVSRGGLSVAAVR